MALTALCAHAARDESQDGIAPTGKAAPVIFYQLQVLIYVALRTDSFISLWLRLGPGLRAKTIPPTATSTF